MRRIILLFLTLALVMHAGAVIQIVEFCPDPYLSNDMDEYLVLSGTGPLDDITISDNHGGFRFPPGSTLHGRLTIARDAMAYRESHGTFPDYEWMDYSPVVPDVIGGDPLRLANGGDELVLYDRGTPIQRITWPEDVKPREGQVHYLENGTWDRRILLLGQSRFSSAVFRNVTVTAFVSPDCSNAVFQDAIDRATGTVLVNMYEFSSPSLGTALIAAKRRGVDVRVLTEGGPVGGISPDERALIWSVNRSGIPVFSMVSTRTVHAPYRYDHAKYMVIDNNSLIITSENFKNSGIPPEGMSGNRGWGVLLEDPALAEYFTGVFSADIHSPSVVPYAGTAGALEQTPTDPYKARFAPARFGGATIIPVLSPDTSYQIRELIDSAQNSIEIEQAYIKNETPDTLNPYLSAAINTSRRGVRVRVLLDSYWYNIEGPNDNDEMAALINRIAAAEHLPLEARCINLPLSHVEKIHNKGVIVDDSRVLVSSINWNSNSPEFNREAGVIIDQPGVARYFRAVFDDDWDPTGNRTQQSFDYVRAALVVLVLAVLLIIWYRRHRG